MFQISRPRRSILNLITKSSNTKLARNKILSCTGQCSNLRRHTNTKPSKLLFPKSALFCYLACDKNLCSVYLSLIFNFLNPYPKPNHLGFIPSVRLTEDTKGDVQVQFLSLLARKPQNSSVRRQNRYCQNYRRCSILIAQRLTIISLPERFYQQRDLKNGLLHKFIIFRRKTKYLCVFTSNKDDHFKTPISSFIEAFV